MRGGSTRRARRLLRVGAMAAVLALVVAACGGGDDGGGGGRSGGKSVIRFAFAPDPVIDYLKDTGTLAEMEEQWGVRLAMTSTWDEFTFFAGGHGDIVSIATFDLPLLEKETGIKTVTFGKYNTNKTAVLVKPDSPYQTLADLKGKKVAVGSPASSTLLWGAYVKQLHNLNFLFEGGDYEVVLNDHAANPELVARGDAEACVCPIDLAAKQLRTGELRPLYDGLNGSEVYANLITPGHVGIMQNVFTARQDWYDSHPREVAFFTALWERGIQLWQENKEEIVRSYPQHFAVEADEDVQWMVDYVGQHDWNVDTIYLDDQWITGEKGLYALMKRTGFMDGGAPEPRMEVLTPITDPAKAPGNPTS